MSLLVVFELTFIYIQVLISQKVFLIEIRNSPILFHSYTKDENFWVFTVFTSLPFFLSTVKSQKFSYLVPPQWVSTRGFLPYWVWFPNFVHFRKLSLVCLNVDYFWKKKKPAACKKKIKKCLNFQQSIQKISINRNSSGIFFETKPCENSSALPLCFLKSLCFLFLRIVSFCRNKIHVHVNINTLRCILCYLVQFSRNLFYVNNEKQ